MKVVHVISGLGQGGAEGVLYRLLANRSAEDDHVVLSFKSGGYFEGRIRELGVPVVSLGFSRSMNIVFSLRGLLAQIRSNQPDVVQTWMYHADFLGGLAALFCRVPVVWGVRQSEVNFESVNLFTYFLARLNAVLSWILPEKIVNCSQHSIDVHAGIGYRRSKFCYVPNGYFVDVDLGGEKIHSVSGKADRQEFVVAHVGRIDPVKNHGLFIESVVKAIRRGLPVRAILAGTGTENLGKELNGLDVKISQSFHFLGSQTDMGKFYRSCDCLILSSDWEGFPNVVAEAMAYKLPCIVTDVGDAAEIVGSTGWVVPPRNSDAMTSAIQSAYEEFQRPAEWGRRGDSARARIVENYSILKMTNSFKSIWRNATGVR